MVHTKNYQTASTFVKVIQRKKTIGFFLAYSFLVIFVFVLANENHTVADSAVEKTSAGPWGGMRKQGGAALTMAIYL